MDSTHYLFIIVYFDTSSAKIYRIARAKSHSQTRSRALGKRSRAEGTSKLRVRIGRFHSRNANRYRSIFFFTEHMQDTSADSSKKRCAKKFKSVAQNSHQRVKQTHQCAKHFTHCSWMRSCSHIALIPCGADATQRTVNIVQTSVLHAFKDKYIKIILYEGNCKQTQTVGKRILLH